MDKLPTEDGYETAFTAALIEAGEVVVPYLPGDTFVEGMDKTGTYILGLIQKHDLSRVGNKHTISGGRYTKEHGHHYWVRLWDSTINK